MEVGSGYYVFPKLDDTWGFQIRGDEGKEDLDKRFEFCPETGKTMTRNEAIIAANKLLSNKTPETKKEMMEAFTDEDFIKYGDAIYEFNRLFGTVEKTEDVLFLNGLLYKIQNKSDFTFTDKEKESLQKFFHKYNISCVLVEEV